MYLPPTQAISNYSTRRMCAGIIDLNCLGVHTGCVQTSFEKSYPEPLVNQGSLKTEEEDGLFQSWKDRQKYFLVVAVNETGLPDTDLPFTQADATDIAARLHRSRLSIVDPNHPILQGKRPREARSFNPTKRVTRENLTTRTSSLACNLLHGAWSRWPQRFVVADRRTSESGTWTGRESLGSDRASPPDTIRERF